VIAGHVVVAGRARGPALVSTEPLSFWGGYDSATGTIIDRAHPLAGRTAAGTVLVLPFSRGSSTTTAVLLEAIRARTAPAAVVVTGRDTFFALASIVAEQMYGRGIPVVSIAAEALATVRDGDVLTIEPDGTITCSREDENTRLSIPKSEADAEATAPPRRAPSS
jgi:predicted aconitase with swiveling domain